MRMKQQIEKVNLPPFAITSHLLFKEWEVYNPTQKEISA